ncbi:MAG: hypothetical protein M1838_002452 [Thelocarpon superellum]|nr:MAG: hypothetical protein M1838_002452 [Thelocarpon superellum]
MDTRRKRELRQLNARAWAGDQDVFDTKTALDSSLKKNTAFIKRLRTGITLATLPTFLQEIRTLSLHKYLSEIISACYEGLCKLKAPADIAAGVEIISALHQRFGPAEFTGFVAWLLGRGLATPEKAHLKSLSAEAKEKEERERLGRQRVLLKVVTELWLVGLVRSLDDATPPDESARGKENLGGASGKANDGPLKNKNGPNGARYQQTDIEPFPLEVLKDLLGHDREHACLPLVVLFVKAFGWDVLGVKHATADGRKTVAEDGGTALVSDLDEASGPDDAPGSMAATTDPPLIEPEMQQRFRNVLLRYFQDVKEHLVRDQKNLSAQARRNAEAYVKSGEIFEDRQAYFEKQSRAQEKFLSNAQVLSDALAAEMPDLKGDDDPSHVVDGGIGLIKTGEYLRGHGEGAGIWEDEEERRFYENLVDLKDRVPAVLLEDGKKKKVEGEESSAKKSEDKVAPPTETATEQSKAQSEPSPAPAEAKPAETDDQSTAIANKTVGAQVDALLARLPDLTSKDLIDQAAIDFCFLNSKASRNRLIKAVQEVPKGRSDLLAPYSRLVATLSRYMPDVGQGLVSYLDAEFRSLQRRKDKDFLGRVRTSNIRYLAELTKFGVVPEHVIFHCLRVSIDEFSRMNIEIICNLLENCGRYLLRNPETAPRMASFLETLQRKKSAQHLGQQERMLIENAAYYVDPPSRAAIQQKERTPIDLFIRQLIYLDLNKRNYTKILKQLRKLHWEEHEVVHTLTKIFAKPGKVKHSNIHLLAVLMGALYRYHQDFVVRVLDDLLEYITIGLEQNDFRNNQRRVSEIKYLGELYNFKMVDSPIIFDTLYRIVTFGHEGGTPKPGRLCPVDLPDDFFRIRLVCTLLETCGMCFDRGTAKKKLDFFLTFFQYYIFTKESLPMDVDFLVHDTFAITRPQWRLAAGLEDAARIFTEAVAQNYKAQDVDKTVELEESEDEASSDEHNDEDDVRDPGMDEGGSSGEEAENPPADEPAPDDEESEEESIVVTRQREERDPEADADFDREFAKMLADSLDSRKLDRKQMFDVPLPMRRHHRDPSTTTAEDAGESGATEVSETMAFSLLTKRGNRQQTRTVELPSDSTFAVAMKTQQQAERQEQQRIKSLVLNYDLRDEEQDGDNLGPAFMLHPSTKSIAGLDRNQASNGRLDKTGGTRSKQRARKLQLSDVDW